MLMSSLAGSRQGGWQIKRVISTRPISTINIILIIYNIYKIIYIIFIINIIYIFYNIYNIYNIYNFYMTLSTGELHHRAGGHQAVQCRQGRQVRQWPD